MIPWLLVVELLSVGERSFSKLLAERQKAYPVSGEINRAVDDPQRVIESIADHYSGNNPRIDGTDGLSMEFADWRFNVRMSNTEPLVRLNVESRGDEGLVEQKTRELLSLIEARD